MIDTIEPVNVRRLFRVPKERVQGDLSTSSQVIHNRETGKESQVITRSFWGRIYNIIKSVNAPCYIRESTTRSCLPFFTSSTFGSLDRKTRVIPPPIGHKNTRYPHNLRKRIDRILVPPTRDL